LGVIALENVSDGVLKLKSDIEYKTSVKMMSVIIGEIQHEGENVPITVSHSLN
jgi:hypothetical protein